MTASMQAPRPDDVSRAQTSLERVRDALANRGSAMKGRHADFMAQCPLHDDNTPSLHVTYTGGHDGRVLFLCHSCRGDAGDIAAAMGLRMTDLFDQPLPPREQRKGRSAYARRSGSRLGRLGRLPALIAAPKAEPKPQERLQWKTTAEYSYATPDGEIIQQVIRQEATDSTGKRHKRFRQQFITSAGVVNKKPEGFTPTWYRAPELTDALADDEPVWIVEGEKDVHTAERLGVVAATNAGGAGSLSDEMLEMLHGGEVNVVLDRDLAGYKRGVQLIEALDEHATVHVFLPSTLEAKTDLTDHVDAGGTLDTLIPTTLLELQAWVSAIQADEKLYGLEECRREALAHLAAAESDKKKAPKRADEHLKRAKRWTYESERRFETLAEHSTNTLRYASAAHSRWGNEAATFAQSINAQGLSIARELYAAAHLEIPPILQGPIETPAPQKATPAPAPAPQETQPAKQDPVPAEAETTLPAPRVPSQAAAAPTVPTYGSNTEISAPKYIIENGVLCKEEWKQQRGEEGGAVRSLKMVLSLDARVISRDGNEDLGDEHFLDTVTLFDEEPEPQPVAETDGPKEQKLVGVRAFTIGFTHPRSGEKVAITVDADEAVSGKWIEKLDFPVDYLPTKNGLAEVWRAITQVSKDQDNRTLYQSTGWRRLNDGWGYVHAGGIITAEGNKNAPVDLTGALGRIHLPRPTQDPKTLRTAFNGTIGYLSENLPQRVVLPMVGHMMRAAFGHNPMILMLVGVPGTYKSSMAECMMNLWGEKWRRNEPTTSLAGTGSTLNASRYIMSHAKDTVFWADDVAPDLGMAYAQRTIKQFARLISERTGRDRAQRDGMGITTGDRPNCSGLITSEFAPEAGSGQQRTFPLPLRKGDVSLDVMKAQSTRELRHHRALLMSSFLQWLAINDPKEMREQADFEADEYMERLFNSYLDRRIDERPASAITAMWTGFKMFTEFLTDTGAFTDDDAQKWLAAMNDALFEAWKSTVDPDIPTSMGGRVRELLQYALHSGIGYISDSVTGEHPFGHARRLGWKSTQIGPDSERWDARGINLGWINEHGDHGPELYLHPTALHHVLSQSKSATGSAIELDESTAKRALYDEGMIIVDDPKPGKAPVLTKSRLIKAIGGRPRVLVMPLTKLFPEDDDGMNPTNPGTAPEGPTPMSRRSPNTPAPAPTTPTTPAPVVPAPQQAARAIAPAPEQRQAATPPAPTPAPAPAPGRPAQPATTKATGFAGPAIVLADDAIYTPDGKRHAWPDITHIGQVAELVPALNIGHEREVGQVWITDEAAVKLGINMSEVSGVAPRDIRTSFTKITEDHPLITNTLEAGYRLSRDNKKRAFSGWTRVFRGEDTRPLAMLVFTSMLLDNDALIEGNPSPDDLLERIKITTDALGMPPFMHPGQNGIDLAIKLRIKDRRRRELFVPQEPTPPALDQNTEQDDRWTRKPNAEERKLTYIHAYDRGGSYLAGAGSLEVGIGAPTHYENGAPFDAKTPGYWRITVPESSDWRMPHPLAPGGITVPENTVWVTTPTLAFAYELDYEPEIHEAYLWHDHARVLEPFYKKVRDGRDALNARIAELAHPQDEAEAFELFNHEAALAYLKSVYTRTIGMMGSLEHMQGRQGFAPDRRHHIVAKARTNILRQVHKIGTETGQWPVAITADTICYLSDNPDPIAAWPGDPAKLGKNIGSFKHEGSALLADHIEYLNGGIWMGKQALTDPREWKAGDQ